MTAAGEGPYRGQMVCIVDDDAAVCDALALAFAIDGITCQSFHDGASFLRHCAALAPLCVLLDVDMPGMDGLAVLSELKRRRFRAPVIMVSGRSDIPLAVEAVRRGAIDFLEKPFAGMSLVRDVLKRIDESRHAASSEAGRVAALDFAAVPGGDALTPRECEVLRAIAAGASNKEAGRLLGISPRTVEVHRAKIMDKLGAKNAADLVRIVLSAAA